MIYLHLFHGRHDAAARLDNWGEEGPVLRVWAVHLTYMSTASVRIGVIPWDPATETWVNLHFHNGCLYYDGMWYGDWSVFGEELDQHLRERAEEFFPERASPPPVRPLPQ